MLVLAVAAGMAMPMLRGDDATRLRGAARLVIADLAYAQVESIAHADDPTVVVFDPAMGRYHVAASSAPETPITNPADRLPYRVTFGSGRADALDGVGIVELGVGGDNRLGFGLYGQLDQATPATITLGCGDRRVTITIDPTSGECAVGAIE